MFLVLIMIRPNSLISNRNDFFVTPPLAGSVMYCYRLKPIVQKDNGRLNSTLLQCTIASVVRLSNKCWRTVARCYRLCRNDAYEKKKKQCVTYTSTACELIFRIAVRYNTLATDFQKRVKPESIQQEYVWKEGG